MDKMQLLSERLRWAINRKLSLDPSIKKITAAAVAKAAGRSPAAASLWFGDTNGMDAETARKVGDFFNVNPVWLETGEGDPLQGVRPRDFPSEGTNFDQGPDIKGMLPVISWVQAGNWSEIVDNFAPGDAEEWLAVPFKHGPSAFVLRVRGKSNYNPGGEKSFDEGDYIAVDPDREPQHKSMVVVRLDDENTATFKRLLVEPDGTKLLEALNPAWPNRIFPVDGNATICGVVIGKWTPE